MQRLNLGCESCVLPREHGWINYDHRKTHPDVQGLDVRKGLPHASGTVHEIYGGNFFDHLTYLEGIALMQECHRVLYKGCPVRWSVMDLDRLINLYLSHNLDQFACVQPPMYATFDNSTKFATFLLGNLAIELEYTGHKMLYTAESLQSLGKLTGFEHTNIIIPDFTEEPWIAENPAYADHVLYVEFWK